MSSASNPVPRDHPLESSDGGSVGLVPALERALGRGTPSVARLAHASTTVKFVITGPEDEAATLLLDRRPPQLADGDEPADIVIELTPEQAVRFVRGHLALPASVLAGKVAAYGDVRRYLAVDPILRDLLAGEEREEHDVGGLDGDS